MANDNYYDDATVAGWSLNGTGWNAMAAFIDKVRLGTLTASLVSDFDTEVSNNTDVAANTSYRGVGHLPLAGGTLSGFIDMDGNFIRNIDYIRFPDETEYVIRLKSDTDTGFYYDASAVALSLRYNGTALVTWDLDGNVVDYLANIDMNDKSIDACYRLGVSGTSSNNAFYLTNTSGGGFHGDGTNVYFGAGGGNIYFRPNSRTSGTAQGYYSSDGDFYAARNVLYAGQAYSAPNALSDGATITPDWDNGDVQTVTLGGNRTMANPSNIKAGASYTLVITQDGTGSRTLTWGSYYKWSGGTAPTLSTAAGAIDVVTIIAKSTTELLCVWSGDFS